VDIPELVAIVAFAATDIDDLFLLMTFTLVIDTDAVI
jgi:hypothetical protein